MRSSFGDCSAKLWRHCLVWRVLTSVGDSLSRSIDKGLAGAAYGVVIVSPAFIRKPWPEYALRGLVSRETGEDKIILPVWHGDTRGEAMAFSPTLADKLALETGGPSAQDVAM